ncbi:MAG: DNA repair exonuclease, partial [Clostridia bacterium]|nr:DNA repair exonuclease [Clostridia bacterium]
GNHDESNFISTIEELPNNLKVFNQTWTTFDYGDIKISGVVVNDNNAPTIYDTLRLEPNNLNIVVMHGQINQYDVKSKAEVVNLTKLKNKSIDYLALGHIHTYEKKPLDQRGVYCYAGCLEGRGFDECGEKGFVLLNIENKSIRTEFVSFAKRKLIELRFDISGYDSWFDIEEQVLTMSKDLSPESLLKVVLVGKYSVKLDKHLKMLEQKLERFYFVKIKDESTLQVSFKDVEKDLSLRGEFIRKVLSSKLTDEEKESTILVGLKALFGEDL